MKDQLDRIEAKLDALLDALADEYEDVEEEFDLDGYSLPRERDQSEPL